MKRIVLDQNGTLYEFSHYTVSGDVAAFTTWTERTPSAFNGIKVLKSTDCLVVTEDEVAA